MFESRLGGKILRCRFHSQCLLKVQHPLAGIDVDSILNKTNSGSNFGSKIGVKQRKQKRDKLFVNIFTANILNDQFRDQLANPKPKASELHKANEFFNDAKIEINWEIYKYQDIPGEKKRFEKEESLANVEENENEKDELENDENENLNPILDENSLKELTKLKKLDKYQELLEMREERQDTFNKLPEILLLGRCNVGKSSILNCLFNDLSTKRPSVKYAGVKRFAGYTPTLIFYNVGGVIRVVDSPGYGAKGKEWQGELCLEYLQKRRNLSRCFLIISAKEGIKDTDRVIIDTLVKMRIPFDVIFTKIDKITKKLTKEQFVQRIKNYIDEDLIFQNSPIQPNFFFVNSVATEYLKRTGFDELRVSILKYCGFDDVTKVIPKKKKKIEDENEKILKKRNTQQNLRRQAK
ncbi:hypothetical protein PACTADRAFT_51708 [Pachysolen tannophilus NRRL Y-2460]|uniref:EngB-type G domain-containing protein n=1 Tax=Pachysolen tannophilus NRRL Y-2460 TaxID=669874 RepID=A0A1E4TQE7_PACTA|nr:hypothetical protein PACTADRAFT_51708 [Pachysolen tannophilus NRRL Y-2460]